MSTFARAEIELGGDSKGRLSTPHKRQKTSLRQEEKSVMIRLSYVSTCAPGLALADVRAILNVANRSNIENNITGMLYWSGKYFMQTLEGDRRAVTVCFNRVCRDRRHTEVELVSALPMSERWFSQWSMGFTQLLAEHRVKLANGANGFNPYLLDASQLPQSLAELTRNTTRLAG